MFEELKIIVEIFLAVSAISYRCAYMAFFLFGNAYRLGYYGNVFVDWTPLKFYLYTYLLHQNCA